MIDLPDTTLYVARLTIEAVSPLSVGSGEAGASDVALVRDGNGLPMIAGASLQGLIKSLAERDAAVAKDLLGDDDRPSRVAFSDARLHDSHDRSITALLLEEIGDPLLMRMIADDPVRRDHVRLDERGTADPGSMAKFDRTALPRGARLSCELTMWGKSAEAGTDEAAFSALLSLFRHPLFRPGGATARGYGRVDVRGAWRRYDDPAGHAEEIAGLRAMPCSHPLGGTAIGEPELSRIEQITVTLQSDAHWRVGTDGARTRTGRHHFQTADNRHEETDAAPMREPRIAWENGKGVWRTPDEKLSGNFVLPGSAVRGALWHRTLFHWNVAHGRLVEADSPDAQAQLNRALEPPTPLLALFGNVKGGKGGWKSALIVDDIVFEPGATEAIDHVSIDRFSGGARNGALFNEELVHVDGPLPAIRIIIDRERLTWNRVTDAEADEAVAALKAAIEDLCAERLALGAKSSGLFTGTMTMPGGAA